MEETTYRDAVHPLRVSVTMMSNMIRVFSRLRRQSVSARWVVAGLAVLSLAAPVQAGEYFNGFVRYWTDFFTRQNGVVMTVLVLGAISLFIITRGKWRK